MLNDLDYGSKLNCFHQQLVTFKCIILGIVRENNYLNIEQFGILLNSLTSTHKCGKKFR